MTVESHVLVSVSTGMTLRHGDLSVNGTHLSGKLSDEKCVLNWGHQSCRAPGLFPFHPPSSSIFLFLSRTAPRGCDARLLLFRPAGGAQPLADRRAPPCHAPSCTALLFRNFIYDHIGLLSFAPSSQLSWCGSDQESDRNKKPAGRLRLLVLKLLASFFARV